MSFSRGKSVKICVRRSEMVCCVNLIFRMLERTHTNGTLVRHRPGNRRKMKSLSAATLNNLLEGADSIDLVTRVNDSGSASLRSHEDDVNELRSRWHGLHRFEVVDRHVSMFLYREGSSTSPPTTMVTKRRRRIRARRR
jgi:hypothetical protein